VGRVGEWDGCVREGVCCVVAHRGWWGSAQATLASSAPQVET